MGGGAAWGPPSLFTFLFGQIENERSSVFNSSGGPEENPSSTGFCFMPLVLVFKSN